MIQTFADLSIELRTLGSRPYKYVFVSIGGDSL